MDAGYRGFGCMPTVQPHGRSDYLSRPMIVSDDGTTVLASHRGALLQFDPDTATAETAVPATSAMMRLVTGRRGVFAMLHQEFATPAVRRITAHPHAEPGAVIASLTISDDLVVSGEGDGQVWTNLPGTFDLVHPYLLNLTPASARILRIPGLPGESDDPDDPYRFVVAPQAVIVSTSRSGGRFVVYDIGDGTLLADLELGYGPPTYRFLGTQLWLGHTDTIFRIDTTTWSLIDAMRLRSGPGDSTISTMEFSPSGDQCVVAFASRTPVPLLQPYRLAPVSGTLLVIDTASFEVTATTTTERWVDELAVLIDGRVITRERSAEQQFTVLEPHPAEFPTYPPRPPGEEWH